MPAAICLRHADCQMRFHEIVICEIQRNRSFKVFQLFAESICQTRQAAAVHSQRVILLFNVRRGNTRPYPACRSRLSFQL